MLGARMGERGFKSGPIELIEGKAGGEMLGFGSFAFEGK